MNNSYKCRFICINHNFDFIFSHMRRHRNEKPFVCTVCGKGFVINFELSRHMRTVSVFSHHNSMKLMIIH